MALSPAELVRMRAEHVVNKWGFCSTCCYYLPDGNTGWGDYLCVDYPCDAARLLDHFSPTPALHLAGIAAGLFGPSDTSELPQ